MLPLPRMTDAERRRSRSYKTPPERYQTGKKKGEIIPGTGGVLRKRIAVVKARAWGGRWYRWPEMYYRGKKGAVAKGRSGYGRVKREEEIQMDWPTGKFKVILADPPWSYQVWSEKGTGRSAEQHYSTLTAEELFNLPVADLADSDCVLFLWVTYPTLPQGMETLARWGFEYKTVAFTWMKTYPASYTPFIGLGHWTRSNAEICLLGTKGSPKRKDKGVEQAILAPVREHSRKPDVVHERIERLVEGPYLELFGRSQREGWTVWGNQTDKFPETLGLWTKDGDEREAA